MIPLTGLGVSDIVGGILGTMKRYPKALYLPPLCVALGAVPLLTVSGWAGYAVVRGVIDAARGRSGHALTTGESGTLVLVSVLGALLLAASFAAVSGVATATGTAVVRYAVLGRRITAGGLWAQARQFLGRILAVRLLVGLAEFGLLVVSALPAVVVGLITASPAPTALAALLVPFGGLACVYVQVRLALTVPVLVLENRRPVDAIRRAWQLNGGAWWRTLGLTHVVRLLGACAAQVLVTPFGFVGSLCLQLSMVRADDAGAVVGDLPSAEPTTLGVLLFLVSLLVGVGILVVLALPLGAIGHGLLYVDRRIRRENLAPLLAAQAPPQPEFQVPAQGGARWG
ncbi:hypothetical protein [Kitasatospora nipponensis]|uniref:hypothetical protein n=1 Tax=Kitasatospora nipponensis TaxID=258049 RepID=UPI0031E3BFD2